MLHQQKFILNIKTKTKTNHPYMQSTNNHIDTSVSLSLQINCVRACVRACVRVCVYLILIGPHIRKYANVFIHPKLNVVHSHDLTRKML